MILDALIVDNTIDQLIPLLLPLSLFIVTATITPGPNNFMLAASGANFGLRGSLAHILGIRIGFTTLQILMASGLGALFVAYPELHEILKYLGSAYLLWLAVKIARMRPLAEQKEKAAPLTISQAALFQFVNPKSWIVISSATTAFTLSGSHYLASALMLILAFNLIGWMSSMFWVLFGAMIGRMLNSPRAWQRFNLTMAGLTAASVALLLV